VLPSDEKLGKKGDLVRLTQAVFRGETMQEGSSQSGYERDHLFLSRAARQFTEVSLVSGADHPGDARSAAVLDYDRDGRPDLVLVNANAPLLALFHNRIEGSGHSIALRFVGANHTPLPAPGRSARDAYGAMLTVDLGDQKLLREHRAGEQLGGQNSATLLVGIGAHAAAARVSVRFPSGVIQAANDVPAGTLLTIYEDPAQSPTGAPFVREPYLRPPHDPPPPPLPRLALADARERPRVRLLVTMATWCPACVREIAQERLLAATFPPEDLAILGVPMDENEPPAVLAVFMKEKAPAYRLLAVTSAEREAVRARVLAALRVDALPATVAIDPDDRVLATYRGVPTVSDLRRLLAR
jgi:hypothetical protein